MSDRPEASRFRARLLERQPLIGTFMKVPATQNTEILGLEGFDFVVLDEEHAPWDRATLDHALLAARAYNIAALVRVADGGPSSILAALDAGASGVVVPHVASAEQARRVVASARYLGGTRGSAASRGGEYGARGADNYRISDERTAVICIIEDHQAIAEVDEIAVVEGIDALFIGRSDLALSLRNAGPAAPGVEEAVERVAAAAARAGKPLAAVAQSLRGPEAAWLAGLGVTALMVSSDIGLLRQSARAALQDFGLLMNTSRESR
jgi:2-keto-3-deoxy-L-rhamnonate aldolase RhmA